MTDEKLKEAKDLQEKIKKREAELSSIENGRGLVVSSTYQSGGHLVLNIPDMVMKIITGIVVSAVEQDLASLRNDYAAL